MPKPGRDVKVIHLAWERPVWQIFRERVGLVTRLRLVTGCLAQ
jgi:hypothetical protein